MLVVNVERRLFFMGHEKIFQGKAAQQIVDAFMQGGISALFGTDATADTRPDTRQDGESFVDLILPQAFKADKTKSASTDKPEKSSPEAASSGVGKKSFRQQLENVPSEFLAQPRFFLVGEDKVPKTKDWGNPDNQRDYRKIRGLKGFDLSGHGRGVDYLMIDFDHVLNDAGEFIYPDAERWYNFISQSDDNVFCERSISGHGLHFFIAPTAGKFPKITNAKKNNIIFDEKTGAKIELFYLHTRYAFFTGNLFRCKPKATIPHGEEADEIFQQLLNTITKNQPAQETEKNAASKPTTTRHEDSQDYDLFRAHIMLDAINPSELGYADWLAVISACKHVGIDYATVDAWNRHDPERYNERANKASWDGAKDTSFDISTLHGKAKLFGYREADARRQWYDIHPEFKPSSNRNIAAETKRELDDALIWLESLSAEEFTVSDALNPNNIHAVALAQNYNFFIEAENFFTVIKDAKALAKNRFKEAAGGLTAPIDEDDLDALKKLTEVKIEELRAKVSREVTKLFKAQQKFQKQQEAEQARQKKKQAATERQARIDENIKTLIELRAEYKKNPSRELAQKIRALIINSCEVTTDRYTGAIKTVKITAPNADLIFTFDPLLDGLYGFDEFQQSDVFLKCPSWKFDKDAPADKQPCIGQPWSDRDDAEVRVYLRRFYKEFANKHLVDEWTTTFSQKRRFHPVKQYFANLPKWDGLPRAENLFVKFLGVEDTPFAREVTMNWLTAAIARIFNPGCRYQTALVLHGNQGIGKSYIFERLGGKWYGVLSDSVDDPHAIDAIQNLWIGEFKEMKGMRRADVNAIKAFIDTSTDNRRPPYGRRAIMVDRHIVFAITVNDNEFLRDVTGNRRFMILEANLPRGKYIEGLTDEYIAQVWAEVFQHYNELFKDGFDERKLELSAEAKQRVEEVAQRYMADDGMSGEVDAFLNIKIPNPVIWDLLTREERKHFFEKNRIALTEAESDLIARRRVRGGRNVDKDIDAIHAIFNGTDKTANIRKNTIRRGMDEITEYVIYGSEYREHICAAEIFNECFGNDKRKSMIRMHEIMSLFDNWNLGKTLPRDPAYGNQRKVFYRVTTPTEEPQIDDEPTDTAPPPVDSDQTDTNRTQPREVTATATVTNSQVTNFYPDRQQQFRNYDSCIGEQIDPLEDPPF